MDRTRIALEKARQMKEQAVVLRREDTSDEGRPGYKSPPRNALFPSLIKASQRVMRNSRVVAAFSDERRSDVYRMLRTQVLLRLEKRNPMIGVLSPRVADGKTLTAVNLAFSLSLDVNREVLLVDIDLRRPSVSKVLGIRPEMGIDDYLTGEATLADCLVDPGHERLTLLPCRRSLSNSSELIVSPRMKKLLGELKQRSKNQMIVFDMPPLLEAPDTLAFIEELDAAIMVVSEGKTLRRDVERALEMIDDDRLLGTVLNRADARTAKENAYYYY